MTVTLTGLAALAAEDFRWGLSHCETIQELLGVADAVDPVAAAVALIFIDDAGAALVEPYMLITCRPQASESVASGLRRYPFDLSVECWIPRPDDADLAEEDFLASHNLTEACTEMWALHEAGELDFELNSIQSGEPVRDEEVGDGAGSIGNVLLATVECYNE